MVVLTLEPMCFRQVAQGNLQPLFSASPLPHTHTKEEAAGEQRVGQVDQGSVSTPIQTVEAKSLPLSRRLVAPARLGLEPTDKQLAS